MISKISISIISLGRAAPTSAVQVDWVMFCKQIFTETVPKGHIKVWTAVGLNCLLITVFSQTLWFYIFLIVTQGRLLLLMQYWPHLLSTTTTTTTTMTTSVMMKQVILLAIMEFQAHTAKYSKSSSNRVFGSRKKLLMRLLRTQNIRAKSM